MSDSASSPAPLDVPRLAAKDVTTLLAMLAEHEDYAVCAAPHDPIPSGRLSHLRKAALYRALRAALPALVEAGALLDRTEAHLRAHRRSDMVLREVAGGFDVFYPGAASGWCPTLREALVKALPAAPALREEGDHE